MIDESPRQRRSTTKSAAGWQSSVDTCERDTKAVLLVGGKGTRLRSVVPFTPKPLARLGRWSFLELLVRQLRHQGIRRIVMCTGYLADQIEREFGDGHGLDVAIDYSKEPNPLGTAGAVKLAEPCFRGVSEFLVLNGDTFLEIDFHQLMHFHREHGGLVSMAVRRVDNAARYGTVHVDSRSRVVRFAEKMGLNNPGLVNAGVYVFSREVMPHIPCGPASLETEVYPELLDYGIYASEQHGTFFDIGTPEDYSRAQQLCDHIYEAALRTQQSALYPNHTHIDES
jgi:NDP-sugar pyrophosphorylase family protein